MRGITRVYRRPSRVGDHDDTLGSKDDKKDEESTKDDSDHGDAKDDIRYISIGVTDVSWVTHVWFKGWCSKG